MQPEEKKKHARARPPLLPSHRNATYSPATRLSQVSQRPVMKEVLLDRLAGPSRGGRRGVAPTDDGPPPAFPFIIAASEGPGLLPPPTPGRREGETVGGLDGSRATGGAHREWGVGSRREGASPGSRGRKREWRDLQSSSLILEKGRSSLQERLSALSLRARLKASLPHPPWARPLGTRPAWRLVSTKACRRATCLTCASSGGASAFGFLLLERPRVERGARRVWGGRGEGVDAVSGRELVPHPTHAPTIGRAGDILAN